MDADVNVINILAFNGLKVLAFNGLKVLAFDGLKVLAFDGLKVLAFDGLGVGLLSFRRVDGGQVSEPLYSSAPNVL